MKGTTPSYPLVDEDHALMPAEPKDAVMFKPGTYDPGMLKETERLNVVAPLVALAKFPTKWMSVWKEKWAPAGKTPVMYSLVEDDPFFVVNQEELYQCVRAFANSARVEESLVLGAPHCVELSYWSQGWYARCFGFAMECSASFAACSMA